MDDSQIWVILGILAGTLVSTTTLMATVIYRFGDRLEKTLQSQFAFRFDNHEARVGARLDTIEARVDARFDRVDSRFDTVDTRFDSVDIRFDTVNTRFDTVNTRFDSVKQQIDGLDRDVQLLFKRTFGDDPAP
jgi:hypothetical protein